MTHARRSLGTYSSQISGGSTTWSSTGALVEMSGPGVTKASTLELLCEELEVTSEEVVAFGDMPNDLPMLAWAGTSFAMADAHPTVIDLADHVAPGNTASQNLAAQLGFKRIGSHMDEIDGEEDVLERVVDADTPPPR